MQKEEDKGSLNYRVLDPEFPLCSNCLSLVIGGTGSGKSYLVYNFFLPLYIEYFDVKWLLICSKTASCDATLQKALDKCSANIIIDSNLSKMFELIQSIRAQAIKTEYIRRLLESKDPAQELKEIKKLIVKMKTYPTMQQELRNLVEILEQIVDYDNYNVIFKDNFEKESEGPGFTKMYIKEDPEEKQLWKKGKIKSKYDPAKEASYPLPEPSKDDLSVTDPSSSDNDEACVQVINVENPVVTKIAIENKYKESESDPEKTSIEFSYGIILNGARRKLSEAQSKRLIIQRMKYNLENFLIAAEEIYGPEYQPVFLVVDDNAVSSELSNQNSSFTQLCLTRRHLHCNVVILVQGVTYINTSLRRNATSYHLLPTMSDEDLKLIEKRLPKGLLNTELAERYLQNTQKEDRTQKMTHIFTASNPSLIIDGCPDCLLQYKL